MAAKTAGRAILRVQAAKRKRLYEEIVRQIEDLLQNGQLHAGDQLPPERELAEIFHVSRTSVREAIRALEDRGILESRRGNGTYVILEEESSLVEPLAKAIQAQKERLQEVFQFRRLIEPQIASLAAQNATEDDIARFREILREQGEEIAAGNNAVELDVQFHLSLARSAKNVLLLRIIEVLNDALRESLAEYVQSLARQKVSHKAHLQVLQAIEQRNPRRAAKEMEAHLLVTEEAVFGP